MADININLFQIESNKVATEKEFWKKKLQGIKEISCIEDCTVYNSNIGGKEVLNTHSINFSKKLSDRIAWLGNDSEHNIFSIFIGGLIVLINRYTGEEDIVLGTSIIANIIHETDKYLNDRIVLRNQVSADLPFKDLVKVVKDNLLETIKFQSYPYELLIQDVNDNGTNKLEYLFNIKVSYQKLQKVDKKNIESDIHFVFSTDENIYSFDIIYKQNKYNEWFILKLSNHLLEIFSFFLYNLEYKLKDHDIIPDNDKAITPKRLDRIDLPDINLMSYIDKQIKLVPNKIAVSCKDEHITYKQLDVLTTNLAVHLINMGVKPAMPVVISMAPSIQLVISIIAVIKARGVFIPVDVSYPLKRKHTIVRDLQAKYYLVNDKSQNDIDIQINMINIDRIELRTSHEKSISLNYSLQDPVYTIYTSGSTGIPKGVIVTAKNVLNYSLWLNNFTKLDKRINSLIFSSFGFDATYTQFFSTLFNGGCLHILDKDENFSIKKLINYIENAQISYIHITPSLFSILVKNIDLIGSKLKHLEFVMLGGEKINSSDIATFGKKFEHVDFINHYGPTETTIASIAKIIGYNEIESFKQNESIGSPIRNTQTYVFSNNLSTMPIGVKGELAISGDGVALGYINNPELTHKKFVKINNLQGERTFLTGDIGVVKYDGDLRVLGRYDNQIKHNGYRIEMEEIASVIKSIEYIDDAVVVHHNSDGNSYLYVYYVKALGFEYIDLAETLKNKLPKFMIPDRFIELQKIPVNKNNKVDYEKLGKENPFNTDVVLPSDEIERKLISIWSKTFNVEEKQISIKDDFFKLGGNSLKLIALNSEIYKSFGKELDLGVFLQNNSIQEVAKLIRNTFVKPGNTDYPTIQSTNKQDEFKPFPLTEVQMAYYFGRSGIIEMGGFSTHSYFELLLNGLDIKILSRSINKVIERQSMLRSIVLNDCTQVILEKVSSYTVDLLDLSNQDKEEKQKSLNEERKYLSTLTFDPGKWPLFKFKAIKLSADSYILCICFDTLIADATSKTIIYDEILSFYLDTNIELPTARITFRDYIIALEKLKSSGIYERDKKYWLKKLNNFPSAPQLPIINPHSSFKPVFKRYKKKYTAYQWEKLQNIASYKGVTASSVLCTVYAEILARYSNQSSLAINLTLFNRYPFHEDVQMLVGDFTSLFLIDVDLSQSSDFWDNARSVQKTLFEALNHRSYDGVEFIREITKQKKQANKAIMPYVFTSALPLAEDNKTDNRNNKNNSDNQQNDSTNAKEDVYRMSFTSQVYIDNVATVDNGGLQIIWNVVDNLFPEKFIPEMFNNYIARLEDLIENNTSAYSNIVQKYTEYNCSLPNNKFKEETLIGLFYDQVLKTPTGIAINDSGIQVSYKELDERSNQVANYLGSKGVKSGSAVIISTERCYETIICLLGILKVGGFYVPVNDKLPSNRKNMIKRDINCDVELDMQLFISEIFPNYSTVYELSNSILKSDSTAYCIYTSGSTGNPKGVMISNYAAVNTIKDIIQTYDINCRDKILGISELNFDLSVFDIFGTFSSGAQLVIVKESWDTSFLKQLVSQSNITIWNSVPAYFELFIKELEAHKDNQDENPTGISDINEQSIIQKYQDTILYWSPAKHWKINNNKIFIDNSEFEFLNLFPNLYYLTQDGIKAKELVKSFPDIPSKTVINSILQLIKDRILIFSILNPIELNSVQDKFFIINNDNTLNEDKAKFDKFKRAQLQREYENAIEKPLVLKKDLKLPFAVTDRKTYRYFDQSEKISFNIFSKLLLTFAQKNDNGNIRYNYASGGGLYPIDIYINVKAGRVENVKGGIYFYSPKNHTISLVNRNEITSDMHFKGNQSIFVSSALSVFFIYNAKVSMPKYGGLGYHMATIEAGIMVATLTQVCESENIGVCSIGNLKFNKVERSINLPENQVLVHTLELGIKTDEEYDFENMDFYNNSSLNFKDYISSMSDKAKYTINSLRLVLLSGDWIPLRLPDRAKKIIKGANIISLGGATEASIWSIYFPIINTDQNWKSIPYGYPLENQQLYVLNYNLELSPVNVPGRIFISGKGLAEGYLNDIEKTSKSFFHHTKYGRIYETGDYGVMRPEGFIEFMGRKDKQRKINGYRIELGEIEYHLKKCQDIKDAIVQVKTNVSGNDVIVAYIITKSQVDVQKIREYLKENIPNYMIPGIFINMNEFPLNPNGKVDTTNLPDIDKTIVSDKKILLPRNKAEFEIAEICKKILNIDNLNVDDKFFDLGATSIDLIKIHAELKKCLKINISLLQLYEHSSVQQISSYITDLNTLHRPEDKDEDERIRLMKKNHEIKKQRLE